MPAFTYTARDAAGQSSSGTMTASSVGEVGKQLRAGGKFPVNVQAAAVAQRGGGAAGIGIGRAEVIQISTQLAIMVETGVTLSEALDCIAAQAAKPKVKKLLLDLSSQVNSGGDFSTALGRHPKSFPTLFVALIKASEKSGQMPKMLQRATAYLRDEADILRKVKGALTYPAIMFAFASLTTIALLIFVLPRFTALYASKAAALPVPTKILMAISDALIGHWMFIVPGVLLGSAATYLFATRVEAGRRIAHTLQLSVPLLGAMFRQLYLSRSLRMIGTMAGSGVHLVDCVATARDLCGNRYFKALWVEVEQQLHIGKQLSETLFKSPLVPKTVAQMISSAEKGGKLAHVMEQVAGYSEQELKEKITELTRYIEPAMIVVMGLIIGGIAMALLLPVFTISRVMAS
ncbi:MAG TPA: type II secretion system F family protein [Tepidisphaeraceae bacterium]|jgi:type IV pilus assembly protein PilC